jgi:hypothetical protein
MAIFNNGVESYKGCVLAEYEDNGYNDSDFYAIVWDYENNRLKSVLFGTTRAGGNWGCSVDATPEVVALAKKAKEEQIALDKLEFNLRLEGVAEKGKLATIAGVKGKKSGLNNSQGIIFWVGADSYAPYYAKDALRVGIEVNGEKHFVSGKNVFVNNNERNCEEMAGSLRIFKNVCGYSLVYRLRF